MFQSSFCSFLTSPSNAVLPPPHNATTLTVQRLHYTVSNSLPSDSLALSSLPSAPHLRLPLTFQPLLTLMRVLLSSSLSPTHSVLLILLLLLVSSLPLSYPVSLLTQCPYLLLLLLFFLSLLSIIAFSLSRYLFPPVSSFTVFFLLTFLSLLFHMFPSNFLFFPNLLSLHSGFLLSLSFFSLCFPPFSSPLHLSFLSLLLFPSPRLALSTCRPFLSVPVLTLFVSSLSSCPSFLT